MNNYSTAEFTATCNELIQNGYNVPDRDGFKSTIERDEALLNSTFSASDLKNTLVEINDNTSSKLQKVNKDTVNFFKWRGKINELERFDNEDLCEFRIPLSKFVDEKKRSDFKFAQYFRKWITIDDIYANWEIFNFVILVFVNNRIYSDYKFWVDDQEVIIRFKFTNNWINHNTEISIYKFETQFQKRIKISANQMSENWWNWSVPLGYLEDEKIFNYNKLVCYVNRISDPLIRRSKSTNVEVLGDSLEFVNIVNDSIDLSTFSPRSKNIVSSEIEEWVYLSIFVPKNFHEFPIFLPVDYVNHSGDVDLLKVFSINSNEKLIETKSEDKQLYVNLTQSNSSESDWSLMIRPIVLSDAFVENNSKHETLFALLKKARESSIKLADELEKYQILIKYDYDETKFDLMTENLEIESNKLRIDFNNLLNYFDSVLDNEFEKTFKLFKTILNDLKINRLNSEWVSVSNLSSNEIWRIATKLVTIPREFVEKFSNLELIESRFQLFPWESPDEYKDKIRFTRPVSPEDIWLFEYNFKDQTWKPVIDYEIKYCYPETYLVSLTDESELTGRIFKAFIFYSDLVNVREEVVDKINPTVNWETDLTEFELNKVGKLKDIFIEKFYWLALKTVYQKVISGKYRYEIVERIINNPYYETFNRLFLNTIDPFFKLSLINYLKGNNFNFLNTSAIESFKESLNQYEGDFKKLARFEIYLDKNWRPAYFDSLIKVKDNKNKFKFENIYDLDIQYEVFLNGEQVFDFTVLHEKSEFDEITLSDSDSEMLSVSTITIPEIKIEKFEITSIKILDPGAGYANGQNIYYKNGNRLISLQVNKVQGLLKGIDSIITSGKKFDYDPSVDEVTLLKSNFENIDDEFGICDYDELTYPGIIKPMTFSYSLEEYWFRSKRFDNLINDSRNDVYRYPDPIDSTRFPSNGDPDYHWYLGTRVDNRQVNQFDMHRWNGFVPLNPVIDKKIDDFARIPGSSKNDYQLIEIVRFHRDQDLKPADLIVQFYSDLPKSISEWSLAAPGKYVLVRDDLNFNGETMLYRVRGINYKKQIIYNLPSEAALEKTLINFNWNSVNSFEDIPSFKEIYSNFDWSSIKFYREVEEKISDKKLFPSLKIKKIETSSYIDNLETDDLAVFNWTIKNWEDLTDSSRWRFTRTEDGFRLEFLKEGFFSEIFKIYLVKSPKTQKANHLLKRSAKIKVNSRKVEDYTIPEHSVAVETKNNLLVRKTFPYDFKKEFTVSYNNYSMEVNLPPYMHFRNQIHLEDIIIFNKSTGEFEDITDSSKFRVDFFNESAFEYGTETQTTVKNITLNKRGQNFIDGQVWGWNNQYKINLFGTVKANLETGEITEFKLDSLSSRPTKNITLEFQLYQNIYQTIGERGSVLVQFKTEEKLVIENGFIQGVTNPLAPVPDTFRVFIKYKLTRDKYNYEIRIDKTRKEFLVSDSESKLMPTFIIPNESLNQDNVYIVNGNRRIPLINSATGKPNYIVQKFENGTKITFLNLYQGGTVLRVVSLPYSIRSVFSLRRVPEDGLISVFGELNKPLSKKFFEFWINGRLLTEEVTIISPNKLVLHGLSSLNNFEIVEVDRDPNEYFSNKFLETRQNYLSRSYKMYNFDNYLDAVLDKRLASNFSDSEIKLLTYPVYPQVSETNSYYKQYPVNLNDETDLLLMADPMLLNENIKFIYNLLVLNSPTINKIPLNNKMTSFEKLGFIPFSDEDLVKELDEVWKDQIESNPYFGPHSNLSSSKWIGVIGKLYDANGNEVTDYSEAAFSVLSEDYLEIDNKNKIITVIK